MHAVVLVVLCIIITNSSTVSKPCRTFPSFGLCPFHPQPFEVSMLFNYTVNESCIDENGEQRYVPCLFSAGFSCILVIAGKQHTLSGCIRNTGGKLVTFRQIDDDDDTMEVVEVDDVVVTNPCAGREKKCAKSEVIQGNSTMIYLTCCCSDNIGGCTNIHGYDEYAQIVNSSLVMEEPPPFNDVKHLYVLAVCYATCATVITMDLIVFVYKRVKREGFLNSYGYGTYGMGPNNIGLDSFGFYKDKFYNSGMPPLYVHAAYRDYYHEISFHKNKYGLPAPTNYEILQQERFGPYYNGVWGHIDQSPNWFGK